MPFRDRVDAGKRLGKALMHLKDRNPVIIAVPRGGVVVGFEVAKMLDAPLSLSIPRKVGAPDNPELAIGAVAEDGGASLDYELIRNLGVPEDYVKEEIARQVEEVRRRMKRYLGERPTPSIEGRPAIIIDDGIATGYTLKAAAASVKMRKPSWITVAVPVGPPESVEALKDEVDEVICLETPAFFYAIGEFYDRFEQLSDEDVMKILDKAERLEPKSNKQ